MTELDDKIFSYLNGELSAEETASVEEALRSDPEFAAEVSFYRQIMETGSELELEPVPMDLTVSLMDAAVDELKAAPKTTSSVSFFDKVRAEFDEFDALVKRYVDTNPSDYSAVVSDAVLKAVVMVGIVSVGLYREFDKNQPSDQALIDDSRLVVMDQDDEAEPPATKAAVTTRTKSVEVEVADSPVDAPVRATGVVKSAPQPPSVVKEEKARREIPRVARAKKKAKDREKSVKRAAKPQAKVLAKKPAVPGRVALGASRDDFDSKAKPVPMPEEGRRSGDRAAVAEGARSRPKARSNARSSRSPAPAAAPTTTLSFASEKVSDDWRIELRFHINRRAWTAAHAAAKGWLKKNPKLAKVAEFQVLFAEILVQVNRPSLAAKRARPHTKDAAYGARARKVLERTKILLEDVGDSEP